MFFVWLSVQIFILFLLGFMYPVSGYFVGPWRRTFKYIFIIWNLEFSTYSTYVYNTMIIYTVRTTCLHVHIDLCNDFIYAWKNVWTTHPGQKWLLFLLPMAIIVVEDYLVPYADGAYSNMKLTTGIDLMHWFYWKPSGLCELYVKSLGFRASGFDFLFRKRPRALWQQTPPELVLIP